MLLLGRSIVFLNFPIMLLPGRNMDNMDFRLMLLPGRSINWTTLETLFK